MPAKSLKSDVVVIGAGIAGMTAAVELLDQNPNLKVTLVDRDSRENIGGLAKWSFGGMFFVNTPHQKRTGVKDSLDLARTDWYNFAEFEDDEHYPKQWADHYIQHCTKEVYDWLKSDHRIKFFPVVHWVERGLFKPGNSVPRFHMVWGTGYELSKQVEQSLFNHTQSSNLTALFNHNVKEISYSNGRVSGIQGENEQDQSPFEIECDALIIASGGICGNIDKVKKHWFKPWGAPPDEILNGAHIYADGRMHDESERLGGNVTHLDRAWHYAAGVSHTDPSFPNHGLSLVPTKSAIWLNAKGERIGPVPLVSGFDTRFLVEQICKQEQKYSWQVLNWKIAKKEFAISGSESNRAMRDKNLPAFLKTILFGNTGLVNDMIDRCPDFVTANTLDELAVKMQNLTGDGVLDKEQVKKSIAQFDAGIKRGAKFHNDEQLRRIAHLRQYRGDRVRTCKFQPIDDNSALPLIAIRERIISRKTLGGIQTDLNSRVLTRPDGSNQQAINGLYAVGEAAGYGGGGMHGHRSLEGTFLGGCVLSARIAARHIAGKPDHFN